MMNFEPIIKEYLSVYKPDLSRDPIQLLRTHSKEDDILYSLYYILNKENHKNNKDLHFLFRLFFEGYDLEKIKEYYENKFIKTNVDSEVLSYMFPSMILTKFIADSKESKEAEIANHILKLFTVIINRRFHIENNKRRAFLKQKRDEYVFSLSNNPNFDIMDYFDNKKVLECISDMKHNIDLNDFKVVILKKGKQYSIKNKDTTLVLDDDASFIEHHNLAGCSFTDETLRLNGRLTINHAIYPIDKLGFLADHQKKALKEMEKLEERPIFKIQECVHNDLALLNKVAVKTNVGILSNPSGSGKTRIAIMLALRNKVKMSSPHKIKNSTYKHPSRTSVNQLRLSAYSEMKYTRHMSKLIRGYINEYIKDGIIKPKGKSRDPARSFADMFMSEYKNPRLPTKFLFPDTIYENILNKVSAVLNDIIKEEGKKFLSNTSLVPYEYYEPDSSVYLENKDSGVYTKIDTIKNIDCVDMLEMNKTITFNTNKLIYSDSTLIVVSESMYSHWKLEIEKLDIFKKRYKSIRKNANTFSILYEEDIKDTKSINTKGIDIILITNTFYNTKLNNMFFNRVIFDDPDTTNYYINRNIFYRFKWLISATMPPVNNPNNAPVFVDSSFDGIVYENMYNKSIGISERYIPCFSKFLSAAAWNFKNIQSINKLVLNNTKEIKYF